MSIVTRNKLTIPKQEIWKLRGGADDLKKVYFNGNYLKDKVLKVEYNFCKLKGKVKEVKEGIKYMNNYIEGI